MWYHDKKKLEASTLNSIGGGYHWPGRVTGIINIDGRSINVEGKGARQRYYAENYSSVEAAGWHDWMWFHFDEMFGALDEMKTSKHKMMGLYVIDEKLYFTEGSFDVQHHDWAYLPGYGSFLPTRYKVTMDVDAGRLEFTCQIVGSSVWGKTEPPDAPFVMLDWDRVEGVFTYADGRKTVLSNGAGANMIRQWRPFPSVFAPNLGASMGEVGKDRFAVLGT